MAGCWSGSFSLPRRVCWRFLPCKWKHCVATLAPGVNALALITCWFQSCYLLLSLIVVAVVVWFISLVVVSRSVAVVVVLRPKQKNSAVKTAACESDTRTKPVGVFKEELTASFSSQNLLGYWVKLSFSLDSLRFCSVRLVLIFRPFVFFTFLPLQNGGEVGQTARCGAGTQMRPS